MKIFRIIFIILLIMILKDNLYAKDYLFLGPSAGVVNADTNAFVLGGELTYAHIRQERSSGFHLFDKIIWTSAGFRYFHFSEKAYFPYFEAGVWFLLNLGMGYSYGISNEKFKSHNMHFFAGLPLPALLLKIKLPLFVEPYYRPMYNFENKNISHEYGIIFKKGFM